MRKGIFRDDIEGVRVVKEGDKYGIELKYKNGVIELLPQTFDSAYAADQKMKEWRDKNKRMQSSL